MSGSLTEQVEDFIRNEELLHRGDGVLIGLSGGADSVCLLHILCGLREKMDLRLLAVHVHHGIRGKSADEDAAFSEALCGGLCVPFRLLRADVPSLSERWCISVEEAGRRARYEIFEKICEEEHLDRIAVAHHMDDNAETMLLNLCRGTGLAGVCGIRPRSGRIIRPLLCVQRAGIEAYLTQIGQRWRTDETNADERYRRNRIRCEVMPRLKEVNPQAASHMYQTARILQEAEAYLARQSDLAARRCLRDAADAEAPGAPDRRVSDGSVRSVDINLTLLQEYDPVIRQRLMLDAMERVCGRRRDLGEVHVRTLLDLAQGRCGRRADLPYGMRAQRLPDAVRISRGTCDGAADPTRTGRGISDEGADTMPLSRGACDGAVDPARTGRGISDEAADLIQLSRGACDGAADPARTDQSPAGEASDAVDAEEICIDLQTLRDGRRRLISCGGYTLGVSILAADPADFSVLTGENPYTKYVDCDKIKSQFCIRSCRPDDILALDSAGHHKLMRRFLIDSKVPRETRTRTTVAADGGRIVWIIGGRIGYDYRLTSETKRILKLEILDKGEKYD